MLLHAPTVTPLSSGSHPGAAAAAQSGAGMTPNPRVNKPEDRSESGCSVSQPDHEGPHGRIDAHAPLAERYYDAGGVERSPRYQTRDVDSHHGRHTTSGGPHRDCGVDESEFLFAGRDER